MRIPNILAMMGDTTQTDNNAVEDQQAQRCIAMRFTADDRPRVPRSTIKINSSPLGRVIQTSP